MNAAEILTAVRASGASLWVEGGSLVASNASRLPPEIKTAIRENKPQIITALSVCAQCGSGGDLWHLDTVLIHEECARFWPEAPPAPPSAAINQEASSDPGGITTEVRIFELPPAGRYRKVFLHLHLKPPALIPVERWQRCVEDGRRFLAQWGGQAEALNWSSADLFALAPVPEKPGPNFDRLARYDLTGLVWCLCGRPVTMLTADSATIKTTSGTLNFYRHTRPAFGPTGDSLGDLR